MFWVVVEVTRLTRQPARLPDVVFACMCSVQRVVAGVQGEVPLAMVWPGHPVICLFRRTCSTSHTCTHSFAVGPLTVDSTNTINNNTIMVISRHKQQTHQETLLFAFFCSLLSVVAPAAPYRRPFAQHNTQYNDHCMMCGPDQAHACGAS